MLVNTITNVEQTNKYNNNNKVVYLWSRKHVCIMYCIYILNVILVIKDDF